MGWFWNTPSDSAKDTTFSHLSPEARAFLEKEAPIKPSTSQAGSSSPTSSPSAAKEVDPTAFSAYGPKYSDIWAQYRPLGVVEAEAKTPQMAVEDVYTSYKERQAGIGRAALENCVFEQAALHDCYGNGQLRSLVGCRGESRTLDSCYKSQQVCYVCVQDEREEGGWANARCARIGVPEAAGLPE